MEEGTTVLCQDGRLFELIFDMRLQKTRTWAVFGVVNGVSDGIMDLPGVQFVSCHNQAQSELTADMRLKVSVIIIVIILY